MTESSMMSFDIVQSDAGYAGGSARANSKREEVLEVATECFLRRGYDGASINAMSRLSGISKESIYRYFSSKKELFEAVIGRELDGYQRHLDRLDTVLDEVGLRDALIAVAETGLSVLTSDRTLALRRLVFEQAARSPGLGQYYYKIGPQRAYATLSRLFEERVEESAFAPETLSTYFVAMTSFTVMLERQCCVAAEPSRDEVSRMAAAIVDDFLTAFLPGCGGGKSGSDPDFSDSRRPR